MLSTSGNYHTATLEGNRLTLSGDNYPELYNFNTNTKGNRWYWEKNKINGELWTDLQIETIVFSKITLNLENCFSDMANDYTSVQDTITYGCYDEIVFQNIKIIGGDVLRKQFALDVINWLKKESNRPLFLLDLNIPNMEYYKDGCFFPDNNEISKSYEVVPFQISNENETVKTFRETVERMKSFGIGVHALLTPSFFQNEDLPEDVKALLEVIMP